MVEQREISIRMNHTVEESRTKPVVVLVVVILILLVVVFGISREMDQVKDFIRRSGWLGFLISILLFGLLGASPVPSEPLTVLITTIFGPFQAMLITGLGNLLAALVEFFIGGQLRDVADFDKRREKLPFNLGKIPVSSPYFLILARMLPGYGPKFVSLISGVYRVPLGRYIWTTAFATLLGAAVVAYGGFGLLSLR